MSLYQKIKDANGVVWVWAPGGQFDQPCAHCGKVIPKNRERFFAGDGTNPLKRATIEHVYHVLAGDARVLYDSRGGRVNLKVLAAATGR
jgi:hypothetical protein